MSQRVDLSRAELMALATGSLPDGLRKRMAEHLLRELDAERAVDAENAGDALVHIRRARAAAGEPDTAIPVHRATQVRQNLRFAEDLLRFAEDLVSFPSSAPDVEPPDVPDEEDEAIIVGRGMRVRLPGDVLPQPLPSSMPDKAPEDVLPTQGRTRSE